jgi:hypothetical protein
MADVSTISALATAGGTLVLAVATFASVRSANRAARISQRALEIGLRPLLMPSRLEDTTQKIRWVDDHWSRIEGGRAAIEVEDGNVYLAMSIRNAGTGIAVIQGWHPILDLTQRDRTDLDLFREQSRDLYIAAGDVGFWQGAIRDSSDPLYGEVVDAIRQPTAFCIDILYGDHEIGQRTISRFVVTPAKDAWLCAAVRHWNLDRP